MYLKPVVKIVQTILKKLLQAQKRMLLNIMNDFYWYN